MTNFGLKGEYVVMIGKSPDDMRQVAKFDNLITDAGLNLVSTVGVTDNCVIGDGTTPPSYSDTALVSRLGSQGRSEILPNVYSATPEPHVKQGFRYRFAPGNGTGEISEVGVNSATNGLLFSRALFTDSDGVPITITKAADDYLDVYYYVSVYINTDDVVQSFNYKGVATEWRSRPSSIQTGFTVANILNSWSTVNSEWYGVGSGIVDIESRPARVGGVVSPNTSLVAKVSGNIYRDYTSTAAFSQNTTSNEIHAEYFQGQCGRFQSSFTPPILKTSTEQLTLTGRISWGRKL